MYTHRTLLISRSFTWICNLIPRSTSQPHPLRGRCSLYVAQSYNISLARKTNNQVWSPVNVEMRENRTRIVGESQSMDVHIANRCRAQERNLGPTTTIRSSSHGAQYVVLRQVLPRQHHRLCSRRCPVQFFSGCYRKHHRPCTHPRRARGYSRTRLRARRSSLLYYQADPSVPIAEARPRHDKPTAQDEHQALRGQL